jgi:hypothetical protein
MSFRCLCKAFLSKYRNHLDKTVYTFERVMKYHTSVAIKTYSATIESTWKMLIVDSPRWNYFLHLGRGRSAQQLWFWREVVVLVSGDVKFVLKGQNTEMKLTVTDKFV